MVLIPASSLQLIWTFCRRGYISIWRPPTSCDRHNFALNSTLLTVKIASDLLISSTGCTCYLLRCISSFDSLAGSEFNMQQYQETLMGVRNLKQRWRLCLSQPQATGLRGAKILLLVKEFNFVFFYDLMIKAQIPLCTFGRSKFIRKWIRVEFTPDYYLYVIILSYYYLLWLISNCF